MNIASALSKTFLFKDFPASELNKLANVATHEQRPQESLLFREGEPGAQMFVILIGSVKVLKRGDDGLDQEVATLGTGSYFGEMAIVDDAHERSATIITREVTELVSFSQAEIGKIMAQDDRLAHHFYRAMARGLARRLRMTTKDAAFYKNLATQRH